MARKNRIYSSDLSYHIMARCLNREWFRLKQETVWSLFEDYLYSAHHFYGLRIQAFVLMSNHFHMLATTPRANIDECMRHLMTETSREITRLSGRINQTYGGPYCASVIENSHSFANCYKYVYRNPVEAGLAKSVEAYPFSTLPGLLGLRRLHIPVQEDTLLFGQEARTLEWLNEETEKEDWGTIRTALSRPRFQLPRCRNTRRAHRLEQELF